MEIQSSANGVFLFLSEMLKRRVLTQSGARVGKLCDVVAHITETYPIVEAIVVLNKRRRFLIPWADVTDIGRTIELRHDGPFTEEPQELGSGQVRMAREFLDRQIVDTLGAKVVRVNDVHFLRSAKELRLIHVDVGFRGLVRRMGLQPFIDTVFRTVHKKAHYLQADRFVSWKYVQPITATGAVHLSIPMHQLAEIHPADLAEILDDLDRERRDVLFEKLSIETAADTLEEAEPKLRRELLEQVEPERAADIVEAMAADQAADLLSELPKEQAQEILSQMQAEEAADVRELLAYDEDTAGGLMNFDFVTLPLDITAEQAIERLRIEAQEKESIYDLFTTSSDDTLFGVLSLRALILAGRDTLLRDLEQDRPVTVQVDDDLMHVAEQAAKYDLMTVPVVDTKGHMLGIVTVDDVLDRVVAKG